MKKYLLITTLALAIISCSEKPPTNEQIVNSLISQIDSIESIPKFNKAYYRLIDSLYSVAPNNTYVLPKVINNAFNDKNDSLVIVLSQQLFDSLPLSYCNLFYGLSLERIGLQDSANQHYQYLLQNYPDSITLLNGNFSKYELLTVLHGKDSALSELRTVSDQSSYGYLRTQNDIENYIGNGMHEFIWFGTDKDFPNEYHAIIPDSLFLTGKINSMRKISEYFVKYGVNIYNVGTDTKNQAYIFSSKPQYAEKIKAIKELTITRTN
ncbi:hypothetical protein N7E81_17665 [Reichenbachiella carrageenanivorans]|uniref:Uncharacterized protein n=1 Tax=Reichenbachiella carrageenanivorans TaxID=2979869 RepID=A0ABY6CZ36_9BACT|nr:hypothetical protein [Reichenbachiella carrageenanivorans]UXX79184.1 hypothetical protein N7E81_17665 [Reichenbachiella carrageenanivorans]